MTNSDAPISVPVEAILDGFRAALVDYAGPVAARERERAIMAEATRDALLKERAEATDPTTEPKG